MSSGRFFAMLLALSLAAPAAAQQISSPYRFVEHSQSLGAAAGWLLTDPGALELGPRDGLMPQLRYTIRMSGPFVGEGMIGYLQTDRAVVDTADVDSAGNVTPGSIEADIGILTLLAALRFDVTGPRTWHNLIPYLIVGGGAGIAIGRDEAAEAHLPSDVRYRFGTSFAGQLGVGIEWLPTRRIGVQLDARDVVWKLKTPSPFLLPDRPIPAEEWVQNFLFSAGLTVRF